MKILFQTCVILFLTFSLNAQSTQKTDNEKGTSFLKGKIKIGDSKSDWREVICPADFQLTPNESKEFPGDLFSLNIKMRPNAKETTYEKGQKLKTVILRFQDGEDLIRVRLIKPFIMNWKIEEGEAVVTEEIVFGYTEVEWEYIGETEKNLGKGAEELNYLLQRMEEHSGIKN